MEEVENHFFHSNNYQVLDLVEEELKIIVTKTTVEETNGSPNENTQQSIEIGRPNEAQKKRDEKNVDALLRTPNTTINVFGTLNWVMEKGWP